MLYLNKFSGILIKFMHLSNVPLKVSAFVLYLNKFSGIFVILVPENARLKSPANILYLNKSSGIFFKFIQFPNTPSKVLASLTIMSK